MTKRIRLLSVLGAMLLLGVGACGSDGGDSAGNGGNGGDAGSGDSGGMSVSILEPTDGASIDMPFKLALDSSVELGKTEEGLHHVHLYFDGNDSAYEVIESNDWEVTKDSPAVAGLEPGEHKMDISLRNADHSPAGFETNVTVNVGGEGEQPPADDGGAGGGY